MAIKTTPAKLLTHEKLCKALQMRVEGQTYEKIASKLGGTRQGIFDLVQRYLQKTQFEAIDEARKVEIQRLDSYLSVLLQQISDGDIQAIQTAIKISDRRAKLCGLDAPVKQEITGRDGSPLTINIQPPPGTEADKPGGD